MGLGIIATAATGSKLIGQAIHNEATDPSDTQKGVKE
jgi:hypothetical protein